MDADRQVTLTVCVTCRKADEPLEPRAHRSGASLHAALIAARGPDDVEIRSVECFSACSRACSLSFSAPGCWTYLFGNFNADTPPREILDAAKLYEQTTDGIIPWSRRPDALKTGVIARLPPPS